MGTGRQQRKRHILGSPLNEAEQQTLVELSRHHRYADGHLEKPEFSVNAPTRC